MPMLNLIVPKNLVLALGLKWGKLPEEIVIEHHMLTYSDRQVLEKKL